MRRRRRSFSSLFLLILSGVVCLFTGAFFWGVNSLSRQAVQTFGPPGIDINAFEQMTYSARLVMNKKNLMEPVDLSGQEQPFEVEMGESVNSIAFRLQEMGIIRNADAFRLYLIYAGLDKSIQAGKYQLSPALNAIQIAQTMQNATSSEVTFQILAGWRLDEIAAALPTSGLQFSPGSFLKAARSPDVSILPTGFPYLKSLEGFMLPGEYRLKRDIPLESFLATVLQQFDEQVPQDMRNAYKQHGLKLTEAVALASMVQREAMVEDEQPIIASVFYNRLAEGMRLESDPTVQFALGYDRKQATWWTNPLSSDDLQIDSPYNTYLNGGLPPGPICNPGISALRAVAYPGETPYYYFRARCDGSGRHSFAKTYQEHLQNACP
ncbi:MAG: endolytic transglycosylase MltG [Anaerolineaceae bacterium]|jgi:UPF0755 protein